MNWIAELGTASWEPFWRPVLAWTLLASIAYYVLRRLTAGRWRLELDGRLALLMSLPLALVLSAVMPGVLDAPAPSGLVSPAPVVVSLDPGAFEQIIQSEPQLVRRWLPIAIGLATLIAGLFAAFGFFRLVLGSLSLSALVRGARLDLVASKRAGVDVLVSDQIPAPLSCGVFHPRILIPTTFCEPELAVAHEQIHHDSGDLARAWLAAVIKAAFYFHPLVHVIESRTHSLVEIICDARVMAIEGVDRRTYARALVSAASSMSLIPGGVAMARQAELRERIQLLGARHRVDSHAAVLAFSVAILAITSLAAGCAGSSTAPDGENPLALASLEQRLQLPVSSSREAYTSTDAVPEIPGGVAALNSALNYPSEVCPESYQGRVVVNFHLDPFGKAQDPEVVYGRLDGCSKEAERVIRAAQFLPGIRAVYQRATNQRERCDK